MINGRAGTPLRFEILGEVRALRGGVPVDLGPAKQRAVLAVLLLQSGRPVPTHQIVDAVWGDEPPENGANVVQEYVAGLRRVLDPDRAPRTPGELIALTGGGYVLRTADSVVDADEFHQAVNRAAAVRAAGRTMEAATTLRTGLARWRGDALAGLSGVVFDAARSRLADSRASAWETWAEIGLSQGRAVALIPELTRLVGEFPLREGLRAQLMLALHQAGRQAEALAVFRDTREFLLDEFGAEPGERMQEAHRKILRSEPAPPPDEMALPAALPAPPLPASPLPGPPAPPPMPLWQPIERSPLVLDVLFAVLAPIFTCGFGSWAYFLFVAVRRREPRQYVVAAVYLAWFVVGLFAFVRDPSPLESDDLSPSEAFGVFTILPLIVVAVLHGIILAVHSTHRERDTVLREQARLFTAFDPARAVRIGIGRPGAAGRPFDDGGLVDLNHVDMPELARAVRLPIDQAQLIVADRSVRGPFTAPSDLVVRGLASPRSVRRWAYRLICIPPPVEAARM